MVAATVALTGATGFVGRAIAERLLAKGWSVVALTRRDDRALNEAGAITLRGALEDRESLSRLLAEADAVVHCAGVVSASSPRVFEEVNALGTARLASAAAAAPRRPRFLHISSLAAREPGISAYAGSKRRAEEALETHAAELDRCALRPPGVYGPRDRATLPLFRQLDRGFLFAPAAPHARFSLLHVEDLAVAAERLLEGPAWANAVVELDDGRPGGYGWSDLAAAAGRTLGRKVRRIGVPRGLLWLPAEINRRLAKAQNRASFFTPEKLRELYHPDWVAHRRPNGLLADWQARYGFEAGFARTLEWYRAHGWIRSRSPSRSPGA